MKNLNIAVALLVISTPFVRADVPNFYASSIDLTTTGTTYVVNLSYPYAGVMKSLSCRVVTAVTGTPQVDLTVSADGNSNFMIPYNTVTTWSSSVLPFQVFGSATSSGANVGDAFTIPLDVAFTSSAKIYFTVNTAGTTGQLYCSSVTNY